MPVESNNCISYLKEKAAEVGFVACFSASTAIAYYGLNALGLINNPVMGVYAAETLTCTLYCAINRPPDYDLYASTGIGFVLGLQMPARLLAEGIEAGAGFAQKIIENRAQRQRG